MMFFRQGMFQNRRPQAGAPPGTLVINPSSPPPLIHMISYNQEEIQEHNISDVNEIKSHLNKDFITWIDVQGFGNELTIRLIGEMFSVHPLAISDVVIVPQRPKADYYDQQIVLVSHMVSLQNKKEVRLEQVSIVLGENYVITFQEQYGDIFDPIRTRLKVKRGQLRQSSAGYLAYSLLDTIIDGYYPVLEFIGDHLEKLEDLVITRPTTSLLRHLNVTRNRLSNLRRSIWPQREAINVLLRDSTDLLDEEVRLHLRDTYDHCFQTSEIIEMFREMAAQLINTHLSSVANRTNDIMKTLTILASLFVPLTFITSIYGMNFEYMPELKQPWAYPLLMVILFGSALLALGYFYRKGWLIDREHEEDLFSKDE